MAKRYSTPRPPRFGTTDTELMAGTLLTRGSPWTVGTCWGWVHVSPAVLPSAGIVASVLSPLVAALVPLEPAVLEPWSEPPVARRVDWVVVAGAPALAAPAPPPHAALESAITAKPTGQILGLNSCPTAGAVQRLNPAPFGQALQNPIVVVANLVGFHCGYLTATPISPSALSSFLRSATSSRRRAAYSKRRSAAAWCISSSRAAIKRLRSALGMSARP